MLQSADFLTGYYDWFADRFHQVLKTTTVKLWFPRKVVTVMVDITQYLNRYRQKQHFTCLI